MKSSSDNLESVHLSDGQHSKTTNGDDGGNTMLLISGKDAEQHHGIFEETISEGDEPSNLMQMSKHLTHRLNNLLTTILANTQLVLLMVEDEESLSYLRSVEDATRDAVVIVHDFQGSVQALATLSSQGKPCWMKPSDPNHSAE